MLQRPSRRGEGKPAGGGECCEAGARRQVATRTGSGQDRALPASFENLLADTGYFSRTNVAACPKAGSEPLIAMGRQPHHPPLAERFKATPEVPEDPTPVETM
jgi:hypothetical protein